MPLRSRKRSPSRIRRTKRWEAPVCRRGGGSEEVALVAWARGVLGQCEPIAAALDRANGTSAHREALAAAVSSLNDPDTTPSARVLETMKRDYANSYVRFVLA